MSRTTLMGVAAAAALALVISACGSNTDTGDAASSPSSESSSAPADDSSEPAEESEAPAESESAEGSETEEASDGPTCDAVQVGDFVRCENFYEDYWPVIEKNLQDVYEEAKATDGGRLVVWDWYEQSPETVALFNKSFPDIKVESEGLNYSLTSSIISAQATGERNTDIVSASIVTAAEMYDQGFWADVDWEALGVPHEFMTFGAPNMMPDSMNAAVLHYNSDKIDSVPDSLDALNDPQYKGKVAVQSWAPEVFSGYGMRYGTDKMVDLIKSLMDNDILVLTDDASSVMSSGDVPINIGEADYSTNPAVKAQPFDGSLTFAQFSGVNSDATNPAAAKLWVLWNAFNPEWINLRLTDPDFSSTQTPFIGLPSSVLDTAVGVAKMNMDAVFGALDSGDAEIETVDTRDEWIANVNAADGALNG